VLDLLEEKCYHTVFKLFRGLLFAFFCNSTFSTVKMNSALTASDLQSGDKLQKVWGEFSGRCVLDLLEEKCCHMYLNCFADCCLLSFVIARFRM